MGKVNSLLDITNRSFIKDKERKTVSEHCLEDPPALDTNYLAKLKKLNKKNKIPIDDLLATAMANNHHRLPPDQFVRHARGFPEIVLKKTLVVASKQDKLDEQVPLPIEKPKLANNLSPIIVGECDEGLQSQTAKMDGWNKLPLARLGMLGDAALVQKANLKTKIATNTASEQSNLLSEKQSIDDKAPFLPGLSPNNVWDQQHVESTAEGRLPYSDVDSLVVKDTEQENNEAQKSPWSSIATTLPFYEKNNVPLALLNKRNTEDNKTPFTLNRPMADTENPFQTPKMSFSSEEGGMRYHFNKWQGDHSVKIRFDQITDHRIHLSPSNLIVEKQLSEHLNELPTKFKVHISDDNESYRYKQSKDEAYDEKDKE